MLVARVALYLVLLLLIAVRERWVRSRLPAPGGGS
jgi:hypothetical protein